MPQKTVSPEIKELRRRLKNVLGMIHYYKTRPPRKNPVFAGAAIGIMPTAFDIRNQDIILSGVDGKQLSLATLARCYGISRQRSFQIAQKYGREILAYPLELREALKQGPHLLASRLDQPGECRRIQREIARLTKLPAKRKSPTKTAQ